MAAVSWSQERNAARFMRANSVPGTCAPVVYRHTCLPGNPGKIPVFSLCNPE